MADTPTASWVQPLTRTFTPPSSCLGSTFTVSPDGRDSITTEYSNYAMVRGLDPICYPPSFYLIRTTGGDGQTAAPYFSPGICPNSYTTADIRSNPQATDTTVTCCPDGMWARPNEGGATGSLTSYCTGGFYTAEDGGPGNTPVAIVNGTDTETISIYVSYAVPVIIHFASSDLSIWSSGSSGVTTSSPAASSQPTPAPSVTVTSATATSSPPPSETSPSAPASTGLSTGAKAGIGVGAGVAAVGAIALASLLLLKRRKRRAEIPTESMPFATYDNDNFHKGPPAYPNLPNRQQDRSPSPLDSQHQGFGMNAVSMQELSKKTPASSNGLTELSAT